MHAPIEIWNLIEEFLDPNLVDYVRLSHICKTARSAFLSDHAWRSLNPYGVKHPSKHFMEIFQSSTPLEKNHLYDAWKKPAKYIAWATNTGKLPALNDSENMYYKLGIVFRTSDLLDSGAKFHTISDRNMLRCAIELDPRNICRAVPHLMEDGNIALSVVRKNGKLLSLFQHHLPNMREVVLSAVQNYGLAITLAPLEFWEDDEVLLAALASMQEVTSQLRNIYLPSSKRYKDMVLYAIEQTAAEFYEFPNLPQILQTDPDVVLAVFHKYNRTLPHYRHIETILRITPGLAQQAVRVHGSALTLLPPNQRGNRETVLTAVKTCGHIISAADYSLSSDKEIAMAAVSQDGAAYMFIHPDLHSDRAIILAAVRTDGHALEITSTERFRDDFDVVYAAVLADPSSIAYVSPRLRDCDKIIQRVVSLYGKLLSYASCRLKDNLDIVWTAICNSPLALKYASDGMKNNRALVERAVSLDGNALQYASEQLQSTKCVVLRAVANKGEAIVFANPVLQHDRVIFLTAVKANASLFRNIRAFDHDREIVLAAVKRKGELLSLASHFQNDDEIVAAAILSDETALIYASARLQRNEDMILLAAIGTANPVLGRRKYII